MHATRAKNFVSSFALLLFSMLVSLVLSEIVVRIFAPQEFFIPVSDCFRADSVFGIRHKENISVVVNTGEGPVHFVVDQYGYRINYDANSAGMTAPPDVSIVAIGDSYVEGMLVENEQTIPGVLSKLLKERYKLHVEVVNSGVGGWDPCQYYLETKRSLALRHLDLGIIFIYTGNDCVSRIDTTLGSGANDLQHNLDTGSKIKIWLSRSVLFPTRKFLTYHSHLYTFIGRLSFPWERGLRGIPDIFLANERNPQRWETPAELCAMIQSEFERLDASAFFVLIPTYYQIYEHMAYDYLERLQVPPDSIDLTLPNRRLATTFQKRSLLLLDPLPYLRRKAQEGIRLNGTVDKHLNAAGCHAVAEYLLPYVESQLALDSGEKH